MSTTTSKVTKFHFSIRKISPLLPIYQSVFPFLPRKNRAKKAVDSKSKFTDRLEPHQKRLLDGQSQRQITLNLYGPEGTQVQIHQKE